MSNEVTYSPDPRPQPPTTSPSRRYGPISSAGGTVRGIFQVGVDGVNSGVLVVDPNASTPVTLTRHVADNAPAIMRIQKEGTTGNVNGAVANNDNLARLDFYAWDGTGFFPGSVFQLTANEAWTTIAHGSRLTFNVVANGATSTTECLRLTAGAVDLRNGAALQITGVAYHNPLSVYAAGTVYTLTATSAAVDFGTTDPIITLSAAGRYAIRGRVKVALNGATFAANQTLTVKLRRTNNTAADIANSSTTWIVPIVTTITDTLAVIELPEVFYTTALGTDTITIFADIGVLPAAGTISIDEASIVAVRLD